MGRHQGRHHPEGLDRGAENHLRPIRHEAPWLGAPKKVRRLQPQAHAEGDEAEAPSQGLCRNGRLQEEGGHPPVGLEPDHQEGQGDDRSGQRPRRLRPRARHLVPPDSFR